MTRISNLTSVTAWRVLPAITTAATSVVTAPIVVGTLGIEALGIWGVCGVLAQSGALLDLGLGRSAVRFVAHFHGRGDEIGAKSVTTTALLVTAMAGLLLVIASILAAPLVVGLLRVPVADGEARILLGASATVAACGLASAAVMSYPLGRNETRLPGLTATVGVLITFAASVTALVLVKSLEAFAIATALAAIVMLMVSVLVVIARYGTFPSAIVRPEDRATLFGFSVRTQLATVIEVVNSQADKVVAGIAVGYTAAGSVDLAQRCTLALASLAILSTSALVPGLAAEFSRSTTSVGDLSEIANHYSERVATVSAPLLVGTAAIAPAAIPAWIGGRSTSLVVLLFVVLNLEFLLSMTSAVLGQVISARGDASPFMRWVTVSLVANVASTVPLAIAFSLPGIIGGTVVGTVVSQMYAWRDFERCTEASWRGPVRRSMRPVAWSFLAAVPSTVVCLVASQQGRVLQVLAAVVGVGIFTVSYIRIAHRNHVALPVLSRAITRVRAHDRGAR